ncbi:MAG: hypothetical protein WBI07_11420, partial [Mobilitalea sp.]
MNALNVFEEIRFIVELLVAEQLFIWSFAKRKKDFKLKSSIGFAALILISLLYIIIQPWAGEFNSPFFMNMISISWYIFLVILSLIHIRICYQITFSDALFMGIAGYSVQHIEYIVVNEVIARGLWRDVTNHLMLYIIL